MRRRGDAHLVLGPWAVAVGAAAASIVFGACPAQAAFPGRNGRLAVVVGACDGAPGRVLLVSPDGSRPRQVAAGAVSVQWSAGGDSLVLGLSCVKSGCNDNVGGPSGPGALRIVNTLTGHSRRIETSSPGDVPGSGR